MCKHICMEKDVGVKGNGGNVHLTEAHEAGTAAHSEQLLVGLCAGDEQPQVSSLLAARCSLLLL